VNSQLYSQVVREDIINIEVHFKSHINACAGILKVISKVFSH
jgi:hypothetical protein